MSEITVSEQHKQAIELHQKILVSANLAQQNIWDMCNGLKTMRDNKLYKELGYTNFEEYCENEVGMKRSNAYNYISIVEKINPENVQSIGQIGMTKLSLLATISEPEQAEIAEKLDIENKADQIKIVRHYVDLLGLPKDEADEFFKGIINKGEEYVEAKAIKYKAELDKRMDDIIQQRTKEAADKKAKDAEDFRRYKKDLKSSIQAKYQLNDTMVSKALDFALKPSESNPGITKAFNRVREMMMNPEEAPDLIMFLMNPGEFIKQKSNQAVVDEKKKIYKLISHTNKDKRVAPVDDKGDQVQGVKFDEISID